MGRSTSGAVCTAMQLVANSCVCLRGVCVMCVCNLCAACSCLFVCGVCKFELVLAGASSKVWFVKEAAMNSGIDSWMA